MAQKEKSVSQKENFFIGAINELKNVTWPTQKQAIHSMILVLSIMLIVGVFLVIVDYLINEAMLFFLDLNK